MPERIKRITHRTEATLRLAAQKFLHIDGGQRAAAFAYSAFFALFPLIVLFVTAASFFADRGEAAGVVISYVEKFVPLNGEMQDYVFDTLSRVIKARGQASAVALLMLVWVATQFFTTLIQAANRAWGTSSHWWKLPLKSLVLLMILIVAVLVGIGTPLLGKMAGGLFTTGVFLPRAYKLWLFFAPWFLVFFSLAFFYKLAPHRRTKYSEV
jgi:Ca2+-transporting ATPase